jgi:UDP-2,3-diacylglucosamine pyrophosphatase LpxH
MSPASRAQVHVRAAFISDVHLGTRDCRTDLLLDFLRTVHTNQLILIGDIVDFWSLRRSLYWPQEHTEVLRAILGKTRYGTRVIYIPGNHDEQLRDVCGSHFGLVEVHREYLHQTAQGRRLLVMHGDEFDAVVKCNRWLAALGSGLYDVALGLNRALNRVRRRCGYSYWSLAGYLKSRIGNAMEYVHGFEQAAAHTAHRRGLDGVICGHIHRPAIIQQGQVLYCNSGDWVDSCSALVERRDGELQLWHWADAAQRAGTLDLAPGLGRAA